jgi:FlaA1/EpsC-like NDP-sugar epimerase
MVKQIRNLPRSVIFTIDLVVILFSILFAYLLRFNFKIPESEGHDLIKVIPVVLIIRVLFSFFFKTYAGIIYYTSTEDAQRIFIASTFGTLTFGLINFVYLKLTGSFLIPFSIMIIDLILLIFTMTAFRLFVKIVYLEILNSKKSKINCLIYGADESGIIIKNMLDRDVQTDYNIVAFIEDNTSRTNRKLEGVKIIDSATIEKILEQKQIDQIFISHSFNSDKKKLVLESAIKHIVKVLHVPPMNKWINGELSIKQIRQVKIEDLLEREPIRLDLDKIKNEINGKVILVTGAAGSIGSELARQIIKFHPKKLYLLDQAETPLYELEIELKDLNHASIFETVLGDVRNVERMENAIKTFKPDIIFHAAAYKHVPLMENNPSESILTNVLGSKIVADLATKHGVKKMVMISTDKAVNPTGVMGASKRIAEIYVQALDKLNAAESKTRFVTTRFGNVLGSNGSVIPLFRKQIEEGGPVTVTHPEITRYFMTIPEACQLVLEAGAIGNGGEIMIFDMGQSVKIADLAKKMIRLSGLELGKDIQINFSGLRPGEKLYEELLNNNENTLPTHHEKIMIAEVRESTFEEIKKNIEELVALFDTQNNMKIVAKMKEIVPEYSSNNSIFEQLDKV